MLLPPLIFFYMTTWYFISVIKKRTDVVDIAWGGGFIVTAWFSWFINATFTSFVIAILITLWGTRLAFHIASRNKGKPEDKRYQDLKSGWGHQPLKTYINVFLLQGVLMLMVATPIWANTPNPGPLTWYNYLGIIIFLFGLTFEAISDLQLANYIKRKDRPPVLDTGLWRYSRHPNYFGEVTLWWGIWLTAASLPQHFLSLIGPLTITILILKVSGIPLLEKKMLERPAFREYAKKTSIFIPLPPKKS